MFKTILFLDGSITSTKLVKEIVKTKRFMIKFIIISPSSDKIIVDKLKKKYKEKVKITNLKNKNLIKKISINSCDIGFSYYDKKIPIEIINSLKIGGINFHPSFLPYNKGRHSTFWAINQSTPFGASSHWITEKFDNGDIFTQKKIKFNNFESAKIIYIKQLKLLEEVIIDTIKYVTKNKFLKKKQQKIKNDYHFAWDIKKLTNLKSNKKLSNVSLGNLIRSTCYNDNTGFNIILDSKVYFIVSKYSVKRGKYKKKYIKNFNKIYKNISLRNKFSFKIFVKNFQIKVISRVAKIFNVT